MLLVYRRHFEHDVLVALLVPEPFDVDECERYVVRQCSNRPLRFAWRIIRSRFTVVSCLELIDSLLCFSALYFFGIFPSTLIALL